MRDVAVLAFEAQSDPRRDHDCAVPVAGFGAPSFSGASAKQSGDRGALRVWRDDTVGDEVHGLDHINALIATPDRYPEFSALTQLSPSGYR